MTKHEVDCTWKRRTRHSEGILAALTLLLTEKWEVKKKKAILNDTNL